MKKLPTRLSSSESREGVPRKQAKILFVYPPGSYVDMPTLAIPCLSAYLKERGYNNIDVWESNLDFLDYLLDPKELLGLETLLDQRPQTEVLSPTERKVLFALPFVRQMIDETRKVFRDPGQYYDPTHFDRSIRTVQLALAAQSLRNEPFSYRLDSTGFFIDLDGDEVASSINEHIQYVKNVAPDSAVGRFFDEKIIGMKDDEPFDLVGISCANPQQFLPTLILAKKLREHGVAKNIILGGSYISAHRKAITDHPGIYDLVNFIATFEGEETLVQFLAAMEGNQDFSAIPNLHYRNASGIQHNRAEQIMDIDALPTPDFSSLPLNRYWTPEPVLPSYGSRGCYYDICTFCDHHENYFGAFRKRSVENIVKDLHQYEEKYAASKIFFVDEVWVPKIQVELAESILSEGLKTRWYSHSRVEKYYTKERLRKLARGGATLLHVGMESADTDVLKLMKKGYDRERVLEFLANCAEIPLTLHLNTIRGFPGEQPDQYLKTLETAFDQVKAGDYVHLYQFGMSEGAPIGINGNQYVDHAWKNPNDDLQNDLQFRTKDVREFSTKEETKKRNMLLILSPRTQFLNGLFPIECCWAAHLLYVSNYRETGKSNLIDQPRQGLPFVPPHLKEMSDLRSFMAGQINISDHLVLYVPESASEGTWTILDLETFEMTEVDSRFGKLIQQKQYAGDVSEICAISGLSPEELQMITYRLARVGTVSWRGDDKQARRAGTREAGR